MKRRSMSAMASILALNMMSLSAGAVTVDISVQTEGEPVPVTEISFQTPEGEQITSIELVEVPKQGPPTSEEPPAAETPKEPDEGEQPPKTTAQAEPPAEVPAEEPPRSTFSFNIPDELIDDSIVIMLRNDEELIKKEPVTVKSEPTALAIEAYDPADAKLALDLSQPEICRRGRDCDYQLAVTNEGNGIYTGPLFVAGPLAGSMAEPASSDEGFYCKYAGRGQQLCYSYVSVQPGQTLSWSLRGRLPGRLSQNTSNCLEISRRDEEPSGRSEPLVQAIQLGLSAYGINAGRPDGIMGPKTQAAIGQFADQQGFDAAAPLESVFAELFGMRPDRMARLDLATASDCEKLALVPPPRREKPRVSKTRKPQRSYDDYDEADEARDEAIDRTIGIGIGIGLGVLGERRRHDRGRHYEHGWED